MQSLNIGIIVGSTRPNRFSEKPAQWIFEQTKKEEGIQVELLDLRDYPMPFYNEPASPTYLDGKYTDTVVQTWVKKVGEFDAYIIVTPEYNHGTSAVLKNALDYPYVEWNNKPVGFVSYGSVGGARAVEQLRLTAIELQMAPIREAVHMPGHKVFPVIMGKMEWLPDEDESLKASASKMLTQLAWWGRALKAARDA